MSNPFRESILREIQTEVRRANRTALGVILSYDLQSGLADVRYEDILEENGDINTQGILRNIPVLTTVRTTDDLSGRMCVVDSVTGDSQNWCVISIYPQTENFETGTTYSSPSAVAIGPQVYDGSPLVLADLTATGVISQEAANSYMISK